MVVLQTEAYTTSITTLSIHVVDVFAGLDIGLRDFATPEKSSFFSRIKVQLERRRTWSVA
jgi:hypothetical protein